MKLKLIEPLRELFKDEVRKVAAELGMCGWNFSSSMSPPEP